MRWHGSHNEAHQASMLLVGMTKRRKDKLSSMDVLRHAQKDRHQDMEDAIYSLRIYTQHCRYNVRWFGLPFTSKPL